MAALLFLPGLLLTVVAWRPELVEVIWMTIMLKYLPLSLWGILGWWWWWSIWLQWQLLPGLYLLSLPWGIFIVLSSSSSSSCFAVLSELLRPRWGVELEDWPDLQGEGGWTCTYISEFDDHDDPEDDHARVAGPALIRVSLLIRMVIRLVRIIMRMITMILMNIRVHRLIHSESCKCFLIRMMIMIPIIRIYNSHHRSVWWCCLAALHSVSYKGLLRLRKNLPLRIVTGD